MFIASNYKTVACRNKSYIDMAKPFYPLLITAFCSFIAHNALSRAYPDNRFVNSYAILILPPLLIGLLLKEISIVSKEKALELPIFSENKRRFSANKITLPTPEKIQASNETLGGPTSNFKPIKINNKSVEIMIRTPNGAATNVSLRTCVDDDVRPSLSTTDFNDMKIAGEEFAEEHGIYKGKLGKLLEATNVSGLVYVKYHGVDLEIGKALTNWVIALFAVDDSRDLLSGTQDLSEVKKLGDTKIAWLYSMIKKGPEPDDTSYNDKGEVKAILAAFKEVQQLANDRLHYEPSINALQLGPVGVNPLEGLNEEHKKCREKLITELLTQWIDSFADYINSVNREKEMEAAQNPREFFGSTADQVRNEACGGLHAFILSALLRGTNVSQLQDKFTWLKPLKTQVCDHVQWLNDLVSYRKEKQEWQKTHGDQAIFCRSLAFNKMNSLVQGIVKHKSGTTIKDSKVENNDSKIWKQAEEEAFMILVDKINDQFNHCVAIIDAGLRALESLKSSASNDKHRKLFTDTIELLLDLKGWLNQGVWAAFSDRYAGTGRMGSDFALEEMYKAMTLSSDSSRFIDLKK